MKLNVFKHSLGEGLRSILRHPLVTLASITTISLMLMLMGAFTVFSMNARHIMEKAGQQPPVEITLELGVTDDEISQVELALQESPDVLEFILYTPEQNFEQFKKNMENQSLFDDFPVENIPYTYSVRLIDPERGAAFEAQISGVPGVRRVTLEMAVMNFLSRAIVWVNYATLAALLVLGIIALFIISNMVRVAVFSRAEEINIMKYVGATNWYIRVPYIIEGAVVGLIGALLAWGLTSLAYDHIFDLLMSGAQPTDFLTLISKQDVSRLVLLINSLMGIFIGAIGSAVSVRRHVRV